jgi:class 3 adenylate cyclase
MELQSSPSAKRMATRGLGSGSGWHRGAAAHPCAHLSEMPRIEVRDLRDPEEIVTYPFGVNHQVRLAGTVVSLDVQQPGWSWQEHIQPIVGTKSCEFHHRGVVLSGRLGIRTDAGEVAIIGPDQVFDIRPGHVGWVEGEEELVTLDWAGGAGFATPPSEGARVVATILFTDIVQSTALAQRMGDAAWKRTLALHDDTVRTVVANFRGREVETAGDSFLIVFDGVERAIRCGIALVGALARIEISIRVGIHSGEVAFEQDHAYGVAIHAAARILSLAGPGDVLVSEITRDLAEGSDGLKFVSRGRHALKGLDRERELFAVTSERRGP